MKYFYYPKNSLEPLVVISAHTPSPAQETTGLLSVTIDEL
jgi:hypothetical protein